MKGIIVSDATPIIAFSRINNLNLLHEIVGEIVVPDAVSKELFEYNKEDVERIRHCEWIKIKEVKSKGEVELLLPSLDKGEAEVIILSQEIKADLVIIDELSARKVAMTMDLPLIGTVGLLIEAKRIGIISKVKPFLDDMIARGIRYGDRFLGRVLEELGE